MHTGVWRRNMAPSGLPAVLVVRQLRLQTVHLRLHVEDPGCECSECFEKIHGGVDRFVALAERILADRK